MTDFFERIQKFFRLEAASGILLIIAALFALILDNSPLAFLYDALLQTPMEFRIGALHLEKPLLLWINDGLMAIFFLLVGLEVKREMLEGQLRSMEQIALPLAAAIGGILIPALFYVGINWNNPNEIALNGWAIPTATDIAFSLGILALLGSRIPISLKLFLMTLAIFDDLGAIVIIALFYSGDLSITSLILAAIWVIILIVLNLSGVRKPTPYVIIGMLLWVSVLKSGVHATLAGVILAFAIPLSPKEGSDYSVLREMEHALHPWVAFAIVPIFAFANSGVSLIGMTMEQLLDPIPLGIAAGLFLGKQIGIFSFSWMAIRLGWAKLPSGANWGGLYGIALLCGVGFTMSLFIGSLAFEHGGCDHAVSDRLGILLGSFLSAIAGYLVLRKTLKPV